jgi:uncharacterized protein YndB with AHSA1/START domain
VSADPELTTARVERLLPVPPADAYDAWVDADRLRRFICPEPGTAEVAIDPRPGGSLRIVMAFPDRARVIEGEYLALERPHRLTFSWRPQWREPESVVTVSFEPRGEGETLMTIVHSQLPPASVPDYQRGWGSVCAQLGGQAGA